ncbi:unnamed protein product [Rhodiola kirilowii]
MDHIDGNHGHVTTGSAVRHFLQSRTRQAATCFNQEMCISSYNIGYYRMQDKLKDKLRR